MSYSYRKDCRTDEEFRRDIKARTKTERRSANSLLDNWLKKESPECYLEDHGCDNSGEVQFANVNQKADFKVRNFKGEDYLLEEKVSPAPCVTFKEDQVGTFVKYGDRNDVWIDWCVNFEQPNETHYIMSPATSLKMFCEHGRKDRYSGFGGKSGWRLFQDQIDDLSSKYEFRKLTKGE